jgi:hypothetical protein
MADWEQVSERASYIWENFIGWFLSIPIEAQILVIIGAVAVVILAGIIVYFVLKGVAYLIYYILKGVYLLLKGIFVGLYKLFEEIYYAISGKQKPAKEVAEEQPQVPIYKEPIQEMPVQNQYQIIQKNANYCTECGSKFSERMHAQIYQNGVAFCVNCGKAYRLHELEVSQY